MIVNALGGKSLPVYGDGRQVRDWLFVEDHCNAIDRIIQADVSGCTFNVGGRAEHENVHIVKQVCDLIDERFDADKSLGAQFPKCPAARDGRREVVHPICTLSPCADPAARGEAGARTVRFAGILSRWS